MTDKYGPNTELVAALIVRAAALNDGETERLNDAWDDARCAEWDAGRYGAWGDARSDAWHAARYAERGAAWDSAWHASWCDASDAARDAALALVVHDLAGQFGLEQHHVELLIGPWAAVCGDPRTQGEQP